MMHAARRRRINKGTMVIVAIFALYWAIVLVSGGCIGSTAKVEQTGQVNSSQTDASQNVARIDNLQTELSAMKQRVDHVEGDNAAIMGKIQLSDSQLAALAQKAESVAGDLAAFKASITSFIETKISAAVAAQAGIGNQQSGRDSASGVVNSQAGRDTKTGFNNGDKTIGGDYIPGWIVLALIGVVVLMIGMMAFDKFARRFHWYRKIDDKLKSKPKAVKLAGGE